MDTPACLDTHLFQSRTGFDYRAMFAGTDAVEDHAAFLAAPPA
jgi:hypothetical protein